MVIEYSYAGRNERKDTSKAITSKVIIMSYLIILMLMLFFNLQQFYFALYVIKIKSSLNCSVFSKIPFSLEFSLNLKSWHSREWVSVHKNSHSKILHKTSSVLLFAAEIPLCQCLLGFAPSQHTAWALLLGVSAPSMFTEAHTNAWDVICDILSSIVGPFLVQV